ncbi:MFS transporter, PCFT/HCP family, solute carrier family 46 (folate transporter), member 1/3 [Mytilus galloprovincialis]|uniref:MFS transporter, PCFT/HCP family, solute carrier family 46 (Folate transporter), member 1/3 n=1 Tax=Mytilus galloprovincialis TaxID=29158 RepID=A0A8B6C5X3_MYTGA|nr:MFS transporter, PCFT/HCP family, solute carrier family 46 (folate transporter), member 1/3 [Mytilus galloprovincialis]
MSDDEPLIPNVSDRSIHIGKTNSGRWSFVIVGAVLMIHMFSYILNMYVLNEYAYLAITKEQYPNGMDEDTGNGTGCALNTSTNAFKQQLRVQEIQSRWSIYCTLASNIPSIFVSINIVSYSDVYGRKIFFLPPLLGTMIKSLLCSIGIYYELTMNWFIPFFIVEGFGGLWIASLAMTLCFISDLTKGGKQRSFAIGVMETSFEVGSLLSSLLSGYLIKYTKGFLIPVLLSEIVTILGILVVLLLLPETLPLSMRRPATPITHNMKKMTDFYTSQVSSMANKWLFVLAISIFILTDFSLGSVNVSMLYELGSPFCWSNVKVGNFGTIETLVGCVACILMIKLFHHCTTDQVIALVGSITSALSLIWQGFANTSFMLYLVPVIGLGRTLAMPMMRGTMSKLTPPDLQGSLFGSIAAVEAIVNMTGSVTANAIYSATVEVYKGTVFFVNAGYNVIAIILCLILIRKMKSSKEMHLKEVSS